MSKALVELTADEFKVEANTIRAILSVCMGIAAIPVLVIGRSLFNQKPPEAQP